MIYHDNRNIKKCEKKITLLHKSQYSLLRDIIIIILIINAATIITIATIIVIIASTIIIATIIIIIATTIIIATIIITVAWQR